jgi:peptidoglycan/xylan/chitin deacetylase (PgdA/CDA1 family)
VRAWLRRGIVAIAVGLVVVVSLFFVLIHPRKPLATVLLYHSVTDDDSGLEPSIEVDDFRDQMAFLRARGYETVFLKTVIERYLSEGAVPSNWVVLTFDGAYREFYDNAYPILKRHGLKATLFVVVSDVGSEASMSWDELRRVSASGLVEIGSHSYSHVPDECLAPAQEWEEKAVSKALLEEKLGIRVATYAYPYGEFSEEAKRVLRELGYQGAVGTVYRRDEFPRDDVFNIRRVFVSEYSDFPLVFRFMLSGYYVPTRALLLRLLNIKTPRDLECGEVTR